MLNGKTEPYSDYELISTTPDYDFAGQIRSPIDSTNIKALIESALTNRINDREMFMKGIDYSYYYEEDE